MDKLILSLAQEEEFEPGHLFSVRQFWAKDKIQAPFEIHVLAMSGDANVDLEAVVGVEARLSVTSKYGVWRGYSGIVRRAEQMKVEDDGESTYALTIVPLLWLLSQRRNYRIFQHATVREIVTKILAEWSIYPDAEWFLERSDYPKYEYKLQYNETDLDFITRILEDAGISFYFWCDPAEHSAKSHLHFDDTPQISELRAGNPLPYLEHAVDSDFSGEFVTDVLHEGDVRPGKLTIRDFDLRRSPGAPANAENEKPAEAPESNYEQYFYRPGAFLHDVDKASGDTPVADDKSKARHHDPEGLHLANRQFEEIRGKTRQVSYRSNCHDLSPAVLFQMTHPRVGLGNQDLMVVEANVFGSNTGEWIVNGLAAFASEPFRPGRDTPRPRVEGVQSAIVVGPDGQEIYTDEFGRVRLRFHWDREGDFDDNRTCWVRVAQSWAGGAFGEMVIPRIDQEVVVDFYDGDPDMPVVVGRLYNATDKVPYQLPKRKVVSTWKSESTPKGGGFNEIMFDDTAGAELVYIQAQKDLVKLVKHDEFENTGVDRQAQVAVNQNTQIGNVDSAVIGSLHEVSVGTTKVQKVDKQITLTVGESTIVLDGPNISITAKNQIMFKAVATLTIQGGDNVYLNCQDTCGDLWDQYKKEAENVIAPAGDDVRQRNKIISGAYADLYVKSKKKFKWAGLAAYASKQVGCGMDYAKKMSSIGRAAGSLPVVGALTEASAQYTLDMLGKGNKELFLDIYPLHRFFEEQGPEQFKKCSEEINPATGKPRVEKYARDGFAALQNGDAKTHIKEIANHEQINVLQKSIYNDTRMRAILLANQLPLNVKVPGLGQVGTSPAELVIGKGCTGDDGSPVSKFKGSKLYDVPQRMKWILEEAAPEYGKIEGSTKHMNDLGAIQEDGQKSGGKYP